MLNIDMEYKKGILFARLKGIVNDDNILKREDHLSKVVKETGIRFLLINLNDIICPNKYIEDVINRNYKYINNNKGKLIICNSKNDYEKTNDDIYEIKEEEEVFNLVKL